MTDRKMTASSERLAAQNAFLELGKTMTPAEIGAALGCSGEAVRKAMKTGEAGPRVVRLLTDYLGIDHAALVSRYGAGGTRPTPVPAPVVDTAADPHPSRSRLIRRARDAGAPERVLVDLAALPHDGPDPGLDHWQARLEELIDEDYRSMAAIAKAMARGKDEGSLARAVAVVEAQAKKRAESSRSR